MYKKLVIEVDKMSPIEKEKIIALIDELRTFQQSESRDDEIMLELDKIIPDPKWSDYIFWSDDYLYPDGVFNYDKFFKKIDEYEHSEEYKYRKHIISLVNKLLEKDFSEKSEMQIVNELNDLLQSTDWMDYLFVNNLCLDKSGCLDEKCFLDMVLNR